MTKIRTASRATTNGVRVSVEARYLPAQSRPRANQYVFAYHVRIENRGASTVQLRTRHWIITEESGAVREVEGEGVVGHKPTLAPGQAFEYTSGASLTSRRGVMRGTYRMVRADGTWFDAEIAPFALDQPYSLN